MTYTTSVMLTRCSDYTPAKVRDTIQRHFEAIPELRKRIKPGDRVLIKPNLIAPRDSTCPAQTHPVVIAETAGLLKDYGARLVVGDSPAWGSAQQCATALDLNTSLHKMDIPIITLSRGPMVSIGQPARRVRLSADALEADAVINLPKFKSHQQLTTTFAVKNMFGCVVGKQKPYWHYAKGRTLLEFSQFLIDICQQIAPAFTLIDAIVAMQGKGPINGTPYPMGLMISSIEPLACELTCAELLKLPIESIPILQAASMRTPTLLNKRDIQWLDLDPADCSCHDFKIPELIPLQFSPIQVVRSVIQGIKTQLAPA